MSTVRLKGSVQSGQEEQLALRVYLEAVHVHGEALSTFPQDSSSDSQGEPIPACKPIEEPRPTPRMQECHNELPEPEPEPPNPPDFHPNPAQY